MSKIIHLRVPHEFYIVDELDRYEVRFADDNGQSVLAKCKTEAQAKKRLAHHYKRFCLGYLLKPDKSAGT